MVEVKRGLTGRSLIAREISVGAVAKRAGVPVSTVHFYEAEGLIASRRTSANHRRYGRDVLRRIAIIQVAQRAGVPLKEIRASFAALPLERAPDADDWAKMAMLWRERLSARIVALSQLRDQMAGCIGCGCLSLADCPLHNPLDRLGAERSGPVLLTEAGAGRSR